MQKENRLSCELKVSIDEHDIIGGNAPGDYATEQQLLENTSNSAHPDKTRISGSGGEEAPRKISVENKQTLSDVTPFLGESPSIQTRCVKFSNVEIREYYITLGDNPACSYGPPVTIGWDFAANDPVHIDIYESTRTPRRGSKHMLMNFYKRRDILWRSGHSLEEIEQVTKEMEKEKRRRGVTLYFLPLFIMEEVVVFAVDRFFSSLTRGCMADQTNESDILVDNFSAPHTKSKALSVEISNDVETGSDENPLLESISTDLLSDESSKTQTDNEDPFLASHNSKFSRYHVRVDRNQHDKATEIILCHLQRPHMRAFHASWFSFFVAFFAWFAITPLLSEVQNTLELSKEDIWTSSLYGTASTIFMRIIVGPACDKFGARICMAFILVVSAIPTALTGLVQTSVGLSTVRLFIGIAGSSFVACQYWTSSMFSKEVAGTANSLVAGWGNLGGGAAQLIMGSVLFPILKKIFDRTNNSMDSSELAWRVVFVVPAVLSLVTAVLIILYCDDSPKGFYRERVRQQEIMIVSPCASLIAAVGNWNVWLLAIQYACSFGVEVTLTNGAALYFKEKFGQTTESAAAIAGIFGLMNLFARSFGGFGSDIFNARYGMRGRLCWQFLNLLVEGISIVIFAFADTLIGAIFALMFASFLIQASEGSTFGIIPYIDRRFTGAVVGMVGAGGSAGAVVFAAFFRGYSYEKAMILTGISASVSSLLSFMLSIEGNLVACNLEVRVPAVVRRKDR